MTAPLHDEQTEAALLGCALVFDQALDEMVERLEPDHFGRAHHQAIYRAMLALHRQGKGIDPLSVSAQVDAHGDGKLASLADIASLGSGAVRLSNVATHCDRVRDLALLRELRQQGRDLIAKAEDAGTEAQALLEEAEAQLFALANQAVNTDWLSGAELASMVYETIQELPNRGPVSGVPSGFARLDEVTHGFQPSELVIVGARPAMGKSSFGLQVAMHAARTVPVAMFSLEMSAASLGMRAVIGSSQVDSFRVMSGRVLSEMDYRRISDGTNDLANMSLFIDESPLLSPMQVRSKLRRLRTKTGALGLVVIDYLQLMAPLPEHKRENRTNQVAGISRSLKILARELSVPFVVLSQLNRGSEQRAEKRPSMADLRESGALEQDADIVLLLHRAHYYDNTQPEDHAEIIVAKQRNGPQCVVNVRWHPSQTRFSSIDERVA